MYKLYKKIYFFFATTILFTFTAAGQGVLDTFETKLNAEKNDSARLMMATRISNYFGNIDSATAWKYFRIAERKEPPGQRPARWIGWFIIRCKIFLKQYERQLN